MTIDVQDYHGEIQLVADPNVSVEIESVLWEPPPSLDERLVVSPAASSTHAEAFRMLRRRLQIDGDPRVIAIMSPRRGEGKTTCALNLAAAIAEDLVARVLLLEANTDTPTLARALGLEEPCCFWNQVSESVGFSRFWVLHELRSLRMHAAVIDPAGGSDRRFVPVALHRALQVFRARFDYVVIDTSPSWNNPSALVCGALSDGVVLAARRGHSSWREHQALARELGRERVVGMALLDVPGARLS